MKIVRQYVIPYIVDFGPNLFKCYLKVFFMTHDVDNST